MDNLVQLIERLESEPYYFVGSYWSAARGVDHPLPFELDCEFTREDAAIVVDGTYRPQTRDARHPFQVHLPFKDSLRNATSVQLTTPTLGTVSGKMFFIAGHINFLARTSSAGVSAQVAVSERGLFTLSGVVEKEGRWFGYSLKGAASSNRATLSNVVGIAKGR